MDHESIATLDNITENESIIEVDYRPHMQEIRTCVGVFAGYERVGRQWYMQVHGKLTVRMEDVKAVRQLKQLETA